MRVAVNNVSRAQCMRVAVNNVSPAQCMRVAVGQPLSVCMPASPRFRGTMVASPGYTRHTHTHTHTHTHNTFTNAHTHSHMPQAARQARGGRVCLAHARRPQVDTTRLSSMNMTQTLILISRPPGASSPSAARNSERTRITLSCPPPPLPNRPVVTAQPQQVTDDSDGRERQVTGDSDGR